MWRPLLLAFSLLVSVSTPAAAPCADWPAWSAFRDSLLRDGGRIIDPSDPRAITTSEGQSYALFFALVANDRADFDHLLDWTNTHLAKGNLGARLPAWLWGKPAHGEPTVLDDNSASDADLWIAYTLIEAGRLWHEPCYSTQGQLLAKHLLQGETADLPELGATLLPGALGFTPAPDTWRLNPSYLPLPLLRRFATLQPASRWPAVLDSALRVIVESAPVGYSPDWVLYVAGKGFVPDPASKADGSYDAIRSYLWAGISHSDDPARARLLAALKPMATLTAQRGAPPEHIDTTKGLAGDSAGPAGFSAAIEPLLRAVGDATGADAQAARWRAQPPAADAYFGQALSLFAQGALQERYRFLADGTLDLAWQRCTSSR